jgi:hypothetical protein
MRTPLFKSIEEMESYFYGDLFKNQFTKADANIITTTTGQGNRIYGPKAWSEVNYEANAFAAIPKEPFNKSGWRLETASGATYPSGGQAEAAATTLTAIPDTLTPIRIMLEASPKKVLHAWGASDFALVQSEYDDNLPVSATIETVGKAHVRAISAYLVQDVDTPASTGFESLDRVVSNSTEASTLYASASTDPDIYGETRSTSTLNANISLAGKAVGTLRDLTIGLIDGVWADVTKAGGRPKVILTGYNTLKIWSALLEAQRNFDVMGKALFVPRYNEASGVTPGVEAGFAVATYNGVPIIPCQDYDSSLATVLTNEVAPILFLDTDFIRFGLLRPTAYYETDDGDKAGIGQGKKGWYETWGELRCYNFDAQGKLRDIK